MEEMKNLTKERTVQLYRELWYKIAEILERDDQKEHYAESIKEKALCELGYTGNNIPFNRCWCCEYTELKMLDCNECPIKWSDRYCSANNGEYYLFQIDLHISNKEAAIIARKIAELPEREG